MCPDFAEVPRRAGGRQTYGQGMDQTIENWWQHGLSGEDRDEWCTALDSGAIDEDMLITLTDEQRRPHGDL